MRFKLVIFDFDGTLADSLGWFIAISDQLADEFGFDRIDKTRMASLRRLDATTLLRLHRVPFWKLPFIAARFRRLMTRQIDRIVPFPGVPEMLERLARVGCILAMVTSNSCGNVRRVLGRKTTGLFSHCAGGASLKGKPVKLCKILRRFHIEPAQAIFIGDEIRDIKAARQVGMASGAVSWGFTEADALKAHGPEWLFTSLDEMQDILVG